MLKIIKRFIKFSKRLKRGKIMSKNGIYTQKLNNGECPYKLIYFKVDLLRDSAEIGRASCRERV